MSKSSPDPNSSQGFVEWSLTDLGDLALRGTCDSCLVRATGFAQQGAANPALALA